MTPPTLTDTDTVLELVELPITHVHHHPGNIRRDLGDLTDLAASIEASGILEPLLVTRTDRGDGDPEYFAVAGNRRLAAAALAGLDTVPCVVRELTEAQVLETMLTENLQRAAISPVEEARAYARLVELDTTVADIARTVGRSAKHVKARIALLQLTDPVLDLIHTGNITLDAADALLEFAGDTDALDQAARLRHDRTDPWNAHQARNALFNYVRDRDRRHALEAAVDALRAEGLQRHVEQGWQYYVPATLKNLSNPSPLTAMGFTDSQQHKHRSEDRCHAVYLHQVDKFEGAELTQVRYDRIPVCKHPELHTPNPTGDLPPSKIQMKPAVYERFVTSDEDRATAAEREAARAEEHARAVEREDARARRVEFAVDHAINGKVPHLPADVARLLGYHALDYECMSLVHDVLYPKLPWNDPITKALSDRWVSWAGGEDLDRAVFMLVVVAGEVAVASRSRHQAAAVAAAGDYLEMLTGLGYEPAPIERADLDRRRAELAARDTAEREAEAKAAQRALDEEDPDAAIARDRLLEAGPNALLALAELLAWDPDAATGPYPSITDDDIDALWEKDLVDGADGDEFMMPTARARRFHQVLVDDGTWQDFIIEATAEAGDE